MLTYLHCIDRALGPDQIWVLIFEKRTKNTLILSKKQFSSRDLKVTGLFSH
jgi:hypothetical protein